MQVSALWFSILNVTTLAVHVYIQCTAIVYWCNNVFDTSVPQMSINAQVNSSRVAKLSPCVAVWLPEHVASSSPRSQFWMPSHLLVVGMQAKLDTHFSSPSVQSDSHWSKHMSHWQTLYLVVNLNCSHQWFKLKTVEAITIKFIL